MLSVDIYFCISVDGKHQAISKLQTTITIQIRAFRITLSTVLLRNNLTENAFGTRPERVRNAFLMRSIDVPIAFQLRSICVPFAFHCYRNATAERVLVKLVSKPDIVGNHRDFPSISQPHLHILCSHYKA